MRKSSHLTCPWVNFYVCFFLGMNRVTVLGLLLPPPLVTHQLFLQIITYTHTHCIFIRSYDLPKI